MKSTYEFRPRANLVSVVAVREDGREWSLSAVFSNERERNMKALKEKYGNAGERLPWPDLKTTKKTPATRPDAAARQLKQIEAYNLRCEGLSYSKIAAALGYKWTQSARWAVQKGEQLANAAAK